MPLPEPVADLRSLDLLVSVAELGSIRHAALAHAISQPAASMRLRSLEESLGLELLDRSHGRARLTAAGTAVVQWSADVLKAADALGVGVRALRAQGRTQLRVAASMTVAEYLVPVWLARLRASDPAIVVSLVMGNSQHVAEAMVHGDADLGFVEGPAAPEALSSRVVGPDDLVVIVAPSHQWARRRRPVSAAELSRTPLILREAGSGTREVLARALQLLDLPVTVLLELGSTTAIKAAVAGGVAPGVLSRLAVADDVREGRMAMVATDGLSLERRIRVVWSKERPLSAAARRLLARIEESPL